MKGIALVIALCACGHGSPAAPPPPPRDARPADVAPLELPAQPLGMTDLASFRWRARAGQSAFRTAIKAEHREDWEAVASSCKDALAADPGHLEAAWLYAVALAKTGHLDQVLAPLVTAGTGDFGKWAFASLDQPALQPWLATPVGQAWRHRVDEDRTGYLAAIGRATIVTSHGDVYAYDGHRFQRLTRTYGSVIGTLPARASHRIAYVTRTKGKKGPKLGVGIINLTTGRTSHPITIPGAALRVAMQSRGVAVRSGTTWQLLDEDGHMKPLAAPKVSEWLDVGKSVKLVRLPPDGIAGDWDVQGLASAIRLSQTSRVISVPGQIDGSSVAWSPDRTHVAFVALLDDCKPNGDAAAAFVAEASTGKVSELERASNGLAVEWIAERTLALAGDHGVELIELGGTPTAIADADGLAAPRRRPRCVPETMGSDEPPPDEDPGVGDEATDAGVAP
jgi:hypothetical protein